MKRVSGQHSLFLAPFALRSCPLRRYMSSSVTAGCLWSEMCKCTGARCGGVRPWDTKRGKHRFVAGTFGRGFSDSYTKMTFLSKLPTLKCCFPMIATPFSMTATYIHAIQRLTGKIVWIALLPSCSHGAHPWKRSSGRGCQSSHLPPEHSRREHSCD